MTDAAFESLRQALRQRGFDEHGSGPHGSMWLGDDFLRESSLVELLDQMVTRRENVFRSVPVVGREAADASYQDVCLAIEAIKSVLEAP